MSLSSPSSPSARRLVPGMISSHLVFHTEARIEGHLVRRRCVGGVGVGAQAAELADFRHRTIEAVTHRDPVGIIEVVAAHRERHRDRLVHHIPGAQVELWAVRHRHHVRASGDQVDARGHRQLILRVSIKPHSHRSDLGGEVGRVKRVISRSEALAEEVLALQDRAFELDHDPRDRPRLARCGRTAVAAKFGHVPQVVAARISQLFFPGDLGVVLTAGRVGAFWLDAEQLVAQREFARFGLRVDDAQAPLLHGEIVAQGGQRPRQAVGRVRRLAILDHPERARLDDLLDHPGGRSRIVRIEVGLVVVGLRREIRILRGEIE